MVPLHEWKEQTHQYKSNPAAPSLPLVGTLALSLILLTCSAARQLSASSCRNIFTVASGLCSPVGICSSFCDDIVVVTVAVSSGECWLVWDVLGLFAVGGCVEGDAAGDGGEWAGSVCAGWVGGVVGDMCLFGFGGIGCRRIWRLRWRGEHADGTKVV